jgi:hypothetical protein
MSGKPFFGSDFGEQIYGRESDDQLFGGGDYDAMFGGLGSDLLVGGEGGGYLAGQWGDDTLDGGPGEDELDGGSGNDHLAGGQGDDGYYFDLGYGRDAISDLGGFDQVIFNDDEDKQDIFAGDLQLMRAGDDLVLAANDADQLTIKDWFASLGKPIEEFVFYDNSVLDEGGEDPLAIILSAGDIEDLIESPNQAPALSGPVADTSAREDEPFSYQIPTEAFSDPNPGDTLTYNASLADGSALPNWLTFDPAILTFSGTPANEDVGSLNLQITATDAAGESVADTFTLTVRSTNDTPVLVRPGDRNGLEYEPLSLSMPGYSFADADPGDRSSYSAALGRGSGQDTVIERKTAAGDIAKVFFRVRMAAEKLWFSRDKHDLNVDIIGTGNRLTIETWYKKAKHLLEAFHTADGAVQYEAQVQQLVSAMAAFDPPASAELTLSSDMQEKLEPVLAASWESAA